MPLDRGLYETFVTEELFAELERLRDDLNVDMRTLRSPEAGDRVAMHVAKIVERALAMVDDRHRVATAVELARSLIDQVNAALPKEDFGPERPITAGDVLIQIAGYRPDGSVKASASPRQAVKRMRASGAITLASSWCEPANATPSVVHCRAASSNEYRSKFVPIDIGDSELEELGSARRCLDWQANDWWGRSNAGFRPQMDANS